MQNSGNHKISFSVGGDQVLASYFFLKARRLQIFRIQRQGSATVLWISRTGALGYLHRLRETDEGV